MEVATILELVKARLGISVTVRDTYLTAIINGVMDELTSEKGLILGVENYNHLMFIVDYASWRYQNRDTKEGMPRHLQFRLHNLMLSNKSLIVNEILTVDILPITPEINTVYILPVGTKQLYIKGIWISVDLVNGSWVRL